MGSIPVLAYIIDWGWLRIGPPYIYININPVIFQIGPLALRWYGLMYVVGIVIGLWAIRGYTERQGINQDVLYRIFWWCVVAGLIGGRLYFVVQQPNFFSYYLAHPEHILATWEGGMAFFGAIFLVIPTIFWRARAERINPLVAIDGGVLFAAVGQIFGRIGNLINGDIIGYPSHLPWSTVYINKDSFACPTLTASTCNVPVQPAAAYEMLANFVVLALLLYLSRRVRRPGVLMLVYLYCYAITQFLLFFVRDNVVVTFLGLDWGLKQAQWTSLVVFLLLIPITYLVLHFSKPVPKGEVVATYGIPQKPIVEEKQVSGDQKESSEDSKQMETKVLQTNEAEAEEEQASTTKTEEVGPITVKSEVERDKQATEVEEAHETVEG